MVVIRITLLVIVIGDGFSFVFLHEGYIDSILLCEVYSFASASLFISYVHYKKSYRNNKLDS